jgi:hypothetical protein
MMPWSGKMEFKHFDELYKFSQSLKYKGSRITVFDA